MSTTAIARGFVRTEEGQYLVQLPDDSQWGFALHDDDQSFPGGFGVASKWELVNESEVPADVIERLGWLLDDAE